MFFAAGAAEPAGIAKKHKTAAIGSSFVKVLRIIVLALAFYFITLLVRRLRHTRGQYVGKPSALHGATTPHEIRSK